MTWPTTGLPLDESHTNAEFTNDIHPLEHTVIGQVLNSYISALGQLDPAGFNGVPTLFDPASTVYDDGAWEAFTWLNDGFGNINVKRDLGIAEGLIDAFVEVSQGAGNRYAQYQFNAHDALNTQYSQVIFNASIAPGGGSRSGSVFVTSDLAGYGLMEVTDAHAQLIIGGHVGQTDPLLDLQDSNGAHVLQVTGDNKIGFYTQTPIAQQTGVTVDAAGIHAACVALGLFTA